MQTLFVYADFNWLETPELIGVLNYDSIRGNDVFSFEFESQWLANHGNITISSDIQNYPGIQYTPPGKDIFACFTDALPDRWGRMLMMRREQILAKQEKRLTARLNSFDLLRGVDDESRMGGFRFKETKEGEFINSDATLKIPPLTDLATLVNATKEVELNEINNTLPSIKWINRLIHPGTSLGGARPKASVKNKDGTLYMAKFPSVKDDYDVGLWEHFSHIMGREAGLNVAETEVIKGESYHILLSRRFDRISRRRIHFASALSLLGLTDGDNASTGYGYPDIAEFIVSHGANVDSDLEELFRRVAFYIIIGNSDDHFRNHGFLLDKAGWRLSPAYDINPSLSETQSLLINDESNLSDIDTLVTSADTYFITRSKATEIVEQIRRSMKGWRQRALKVGLSRRDIELFGSRIDKK